MHERVWRLIILLAAVGALAGPAAGQDVEMAEPVDLPRGGIGLAVPADCELAPLAEPHQLLVAVKTYDDERVLGITLSAYPVEADVAASEFAEAMIVYLQEQLHLRNLSEIDGGAMEVGGLNGSMRTLAYEFRGQDTDAESVCFVRPMEEMGYSICYVLTVEAPAHESDGIAGVLEAVAATVSFQDIQPTSLAGAGGPGEQVSAPHLGFSVRPPEHWYARSGPASVEMGQVDYTLGGEIIPAAHVTVTAIGADETAADCACKSLAAAREIGEAAGLEAEVISDAPAAMGGVEGREFILLQRPAAQTNDAESGDAENGDAQEAGQDDAESGDTENGDAQEAGQDDAENGDTENGDAQEAGQDDAENGDTEEAGQDDAENGDAQEAGQDDAEPTDDADASEEHPAPAEAAIIAQRVICVDLPAERGGPRSYALTLMCRGDDVEAARAMMAALAEGFELIALAGDAADEPVDDAPDGPVDDAPDEPVDDAPDGPVDDAPDGPVDE